MAREYWLMKSEPHKYSWTTFCKEYVDEGPILWDGVRNYEARNNMRAMTKGDLVLYYHSQASKSVVGIARVENEAYPDPTTDDDRWSVVDIVPVRSFEQPVSLKDVKARDDLAEIGLIKRSRLSVMPLTKAEFDTILEMGKTKLPRGAKAMDAEQAKAEVAKGCVDGSGLSEGEPLPAYAKKKKAAAKKTTPAAKKKKAKKKKAKKKTPAAKKTKAKAGAKKPPAKKKKTTKKTTKNG